MRSLKHPATIIATLALIVALAGTGYASGVISGSQIRNNSISAAKLAPSVRAGLHYGAPRVETRTGNSVNLPPYGLGIIEQADSYTFCPPSWSVVSAGYSVASMPSTGALLPQLYVDNRSGIASATFFNFNSNVALQGGEVIAVCVHY
jgi:hypothetical protein